MTFPVEFKEKLVKYKIRQIFIVFNSTSDISRVLSSDADRLARLLIAYRYCGNSGHIDSTDTIDSKVVMDKNSVDIIGTIDSKVIRDENRIDTIANQQ